MLLANPQNKSTVFMSDAGGGIPVSGRNFTFDDSATTFLAFNPPFNNPLASGTYKPTNYVEVYHGEESVDYFPAPAPPGPWNNCTMAALNGDDPNGPWRLFVVDDMEQDDGNIAGGWSINIITSDAGTPAADLAINGFVDHPVVYPGQSLTYTLSVSNNGPASAAGVYVTNVLPASLAYDGCDGGVAVVSVSNNVVLLYLGNITNNFGWNYRIYAYPNSNVQNRFTLAANVASTQNDLNLDNNRVTIPVQPVDAPQLSMEWKTEHRDIALSWPADAGYIVEMTDSLRPPQTWVPVTNYTINGTRCEATISPTNAAAFFRLRSTP